MSFETLVSLIVGIAFVYGLDYVAKRITRARELPIRIEVTDTDSIVTANDSVLFVQPSVARYTVSPRSKRLQLAKTDDTSAIAHRFATFGPMHFESSGYVS